MSLGFLHTGYIRPPDPNQFFTDFSEYSAGAAPADWSVANWTIQDPSDISVTVENDTESAGGKKLSINQNSAGRSGVYWQTPKLADIVEVLCVHTSNVGDYNELDLCVQMSPDPDQNYYSMALQIGNNNRILRKSVNQTQTALASSAFDFDFDGALFKQFSRIYRNNLTGLLKAKHWQYLLSNEPTNWTFETTDTAITEKGYVGFFGWEARKHYVHWLGVGLDGQSPPTP